MHPGSTPRAPKGDPKGAPERPERPQGPRSAPERVPRALRDAIREPAEVLGTPENEALAYTRALFSLLRPRRILCAPESALAGAPGARVAHGTPPPPPPPPPRDTFKPYLLTKV